jgi:hypothetical protein
MQICCLSTNNIICKNKPPSQYRVLKKINACMGFFLADDLQKSISVASNLFARFVFSVHVSASYSKILWTKAWYMSFLVLWRTDLFRKFYKDERRPQRVKNAAVWERWGLKGIHVLNTKPCDSDKSARPMVLWGSDRAGWAWTDITVVLCRYVTYASIVECNIICSGFHFFSLPCIRVV